MNEEVKKSFDANMFGSLNVIRAVLPYMRSAVPSISKSLQEQIVKKTADMQWIFRVTDSQINVLDVLKGKSR